MITIKCPECSAGLQVTFKEQEYEGWKACRNCGVPSYIIVSADGRNNVKSLHTLILECKERPMVAEALYFIMNRGEAFVDDLYFNIGRKMENDMNTLQQWHVINKTGNHFEINKVLEPFLMKEIKPYLPKNEKNNFLSELDI